MLLLNDCRIVAFEFRFNVPLVTKEVILVTLFPANLLASTKNNDCRKLTV